eukprot:2736246-Rhodomonas_salina.1
MRQRCPPRARDRDRDRDRERDTKRAREKRASVCVSQDLEQLFELEGLFGDEADVDHVGGQRGVHGDEPACERARCNEEGGARARTRARV